VPDRRAGEGRYAHVEREQRWLVAGVPDGCGRGSEIVDRYIRGTRLRLRRAETRGEVVFKLGQKVRVDPADPEVVKLTTIYLSHDEFDTLAVLPAGEVSKTRWTLEWGNMTVAIDEFHGRLRGLVLGEAELDPGAELLALPAFAVRDVTHDDRFSGGALALGTDAEIAVVLRDVTSTSGR
jgi:CYTH domain-containing protein